MALVPAPPNGLSAIWRCATWDYERVEGFCLLLRTESATGGQIRTERTCSPAHDQFSSGPNGSRGAPAVWSAAYGRRLPSVRLRVVTSPDPVVSAVRVAGP